MIGCIAGISPSDVHRPLPYTLNIISCHSDLPKVGGGRFGSGRWEMGVAGEWNIAGGRKVYGWWVPLYLYNYTR